MRLSTAVSLAVLTGVVIAAVAEWILFAAFHPQRGGTSVDVTKLALTVVGGVGGVVALVIAYRRQRDVEQGRFVERFGAAAAQLGATDVAVRIAGVYAMAGVADESDGLRRQQCIDVLCGYLRLPYDAAHGGSGRTKRVVTVPNPQVEDLDDPGKTEEHHEYRNYDREVRATIVRVIAAHLCSEAEYSWSAYDFDFRTAYLEDANFDGATFSGDTRFDSATLSGDTSFTGATLSGTTSFDRATLSDTTRFGGATFSGDTRFVGATFSGDTSFDGATFSGTTRFYDATLSGTTRFYDVTFSGTTRFDSHPLRRRVLPRHPHRHHPVRRRHLLRHLLHRRDPLRRHLVRPCHLLRHHLVRGRHPLRHHLVRPYDLLQHYTVRRRHPLRHHPIRRRHLLRRHLVRRCRRLRYLHVWKCGLWRTAHLVRRPQTMGTTGTGLRLVCGHHSETRQCRTSGLAAGRGTPEANSR
nr:pentapeptide repeat-containing protein [Nocardia mikamii]